MRGRVLALHGVIFFTCIPLGMAVGGFVAEVVGVTPALVLLGIATGVGTVVTLAVDRSLIDGIRLAADLEPERVAVATAVLDGPTGQPQPLAGDPTEGLASVEHAAGADQVRATPDPSRTSPTRQV
jgi:hypothetical protein